MTRSLSWEFLRAFRVPPSQRPEPSWNGARALVECARLALGDDVRELDALLSESDAALERLGGDPSREDWASFRPLALGREEAWSDWLAWLLEKSKTGILAAELLGDEPSRCTGLANMRREEVLPDGCRADIVFRLRSGEVVHIEVKVGDEAYEKTYDTGKALRAALGAADTVRDLILLPLERHVDAWQAATESHPKDFRFKVTPIRWTAVSRGIRDTLSQGGESPTWEAWAYGFTGALEQRLLGHPHVPAHVATADMPLSMLAGRACLVRLLKTSGRNRT